MSADRDLSIREMLDIVAKMDALDRVLMAEPLLLARGIIQGGIAAAKAGRQEIDERRAELKTERALSSARASARLEVAGVPRQVIDQAREHGRRARRPAV